MWNFFRLENEHLNNCGKFRAVRDISVAPMDASDQAAILKMMDEEDGVIHRRVRKVTAAATSTATNQAGGGKHSGPKISTTSSQASMTTVIHRTKDSTVRFHNPLHRKNKSESIEESSAERN